MREVLFEFIVHGNFVKVVAVDPDTNTEVAIVGDRRLTRQELELAAIKKLNYVLKKGKHDSFLPVYRNVDLQ